MKDNQLIKYLLSKDFWRQIKIALAIFFGIIFLVNISLWIITRHGSSRAVPDFKGLSLTDANELADDFNMRIAIMDSVYNQDLKPGSVVEQEPKPGVKVKKNRRIFLVLNAMNPEKVNMPNVVGVSMRQAQAILESNGLAIGHIKYVPDIATNNVLKQRINGNDIKPGIEINKGTHIDLTLGKSGGESTQIPLLTGLTRRQAEKIISQAYLNLGAVLYDKSVETAADSLNAVVFKQKPDSDDKSSISLGSIVDIWLSVKKDETQQTEEKDE